MEPMTLGSPVGSQASPGFISPYLPEFLMGESTPGSTTAQNIAGTPRKTSKHVSFGSLPTMRSSTPDAMESHKPRGTQLMLNAPHTPVEKSGGPPTRDLFDTLTSPAQFHTPTSSHDSSFQHMKVPVSFALSVMLSADNTAQTAGSIWLKLIQYGILIPNSVKPFFKSAASRNSLPEPSHCGIDETRNTWVTIFGFPPSAAAFILSQFSHYGSILEKKMPAKGNWMHVRYQTKLECRKALSNNGKVFGGTIMIGVMLCKDQEVLNDIRNKENVPYQRIAFVESTSGTAGTRGTPNQSLSSPASSIASPKWFNTSNLSYSGTPNSSVTDVRPLGQAYRMAQADSEVLVQTNIPQRSTGMVSKAMEYVFGW